MTFAFERLMMRFAIVALEILVWTAGDRLPGFLKEAADETERDLQRLSARALDSNPTYPSSTAG